MAEDAKRKLVVCEFMTLDGVMQSPGLADEDTEGGFRCGGWQQPYFDEVFQQAVDSAMAAADALLLGRKTYDIFARYWPTSKDPEADHINSFRKYVPSTTRDRLDWQNSFLIKGDVPPEIAKLKQQPGKDILVFGSATLVQTLIRHDLVDEMLLVIHPLTLGSGKRLFREGDLRHAFELADSRSTKKGVLITRYRTTS
jgi:dihydrofolate reductase